MKIKVMDVIVKAAQLNAIAGKKMPIRMSYAVSKNREIFSKEVDKYETERIKLCEAYADRDADGKPVIAEREENGQKLSEYIFSKENRAELEKALADFRGMDVHLAIQKISMKDLEKIDESDRFDALSPNELEALYFMIEE
jgi:hypothetical protein